MGNDGGSIQNRSELVKTKSIDRNKKDINDLEDYYTCAISRQDLEAPIVSCRLGRLYNRNALIQYMIDRKEGIKDQSDVAAHIKSLKKVTLLNLKKPKEYICPLTHKRFGRGMFIFLNCGCVFSKQKFESCPICNVKCDSTTVINPVRNDINEAAKMLKKKSKLKNDTNLLRI